MPSHRIPNILLIDDEPETSLLLPLHADGRATVKVLHPNVVEMEDLNDADLVLVDYGLDDWPERDNISQICLRPADGLALAALLRRHTGTRDDRRPVAFAIYTGQINAVASPLPPENSLPALAALTNLEWIFAKGSPGDRQSLEQIVALAEAVTRLPRHWAGGETPGESALDELCGLLAVTGSGEISTQLRQELEDALPPIHEISQWSHGLAVLRWLLQRVLPYPCFLWPAPYLSARLRIAWPALEEALGEGKPLRRSLADAEYVGILRNFGGTRWWRARVELWLWDKLGALSTDDDAVYELVCYVAEESLPRSSPPRRPLVCLNTAYEPIQEFAAIEDALRIRPDGWPAYAEQAWTALALAKAEPRLRALVLQEERERLAQ